MLATRQGGTTSLGSFSGSTRAVWILGRPSGRRCDVNEGTSARAAAERRGRAGSADGREGRERWRGGRDDGGWVLLKVRPGSTAERDGGRGDERDEDRLRPDDEVTVVMSDVERRRGSYSGDSWEGERSGAPEKSEGLKAGRSEVERMRQQPQISGRPC